MMQLRHNFAVSQSRSGAEAQIAAVTRSGINVAMVAIVGPIDLLTFMQAAKSYLLQNSSKLWTFTCPGNSGGTVAACNKHDGNV